MKKTRLLIAACMAAAWTLTSVTGCTTTANAATADTSTTAAAASPGQEQNEKQKPEDVLQKLVTEGRLTQEKYDAIQTYLKENMPEKPESMENGNPPEKPEGAGNGSRPGKPEGTENGSRPEKPEGAENGSRPEKPEGAGNGSRPDKPEGMEGGHGPGMMINAETLEKLLGSGIITQEEYETIKAALPEMPEKAPDMQNQQKTE